MIADAISIKVRARVTTSRRLVIDSPPPLRPRAVYDDAIGVATRLLAVLTFSARPIGSHPTCVQALAHGLARLDIGQERSQGFDGSGILDQEQCRCDSALR